MTHQHANEQLGKNWRRFTMNELRTDPEKLRQWYGSPQQSFGVLLIQFENRDGAFAWQSRNGGYVFSDRDLVVWFDGDAFCAHTVLSHPLTRGHNGTLLGPEAG